MLHCRYYKLKKSHGLVLVVASSPRLLRVSPALPVPARSGKLPREECALAAPQASHDGGGRQSCTPGRRIVLRLVSEGGGGASHDAAGSGGSALMKERGRQRGREHAQRTITQTLLLLSLTVSSLLTCTSSSTSSGVFFLWFAGTEALTRPNALLMGLCASPVPQNFKCLHSAHSSFYCWALQQLCMKHRAK